MYTGVGCGFIVVHCQSCFILGVSPLLLGVGVARFYSECGFIDVGRGSGVDRSVLVLVSQRRWWYYVGFSAGFGAKKGYRICNQCKVYSIN